MNRTHRVSFVTDFSFLPLCELSRFQHTVARIPLERPGITVRDVAELLGDTEDIVRKHYAAWIPERQERLTAVLKAACETKPKPNVIAMPEPASR